METESVGEVIEAVICTALCSAAACLVAWFGKKFLDVGEKEEINVYVNTVPLDMEKLDPDECPPDCECKK